MISGNCRYFQQKGWRASLALCLIVLMTCLSMGKRGECAQPSVTRQLMAEAYLHYAGVRRPVNYAKALRLYLQAAELGDAEAQFIVGGMYYKGQGVDPDPETAVKWLLKAARQGKSSSESQAIIGTMYLQGRGLPQNFSLARQYLAQAAEQGEITAINNLAYMYYNGLGGEKDFGKALSLYEQAALKGDAMAQSNVAMMYANGLGAGVDRVRAYAWYSLAASQGNLSATMARNRLMTLMGWQELKQAQAMSVELYDRLESVQYGTAQPSVPEKN